MRILLIGIKDLIKRWSNIMVFDGHQTKVFTERWFVPNNSYRVFWNLNFRRIDKKSEESCITFLILSIRYLQLNWISSLKNFERKDSKWLKFQVLFIIIIIMIKSNREQWHNFLLHSHYLLVWRQIKKFLNIAKCCFHARHRWICEESNTQHEMKNGKQMKRE